MLVPVFIVIICDILAVSPKCVHVDLLLSINFPHFFFKTVHTLAAPAPPPPPPQPHTHIHTFSEKARAAPLLCPFPCLQFLFFSFFHSSSPYKMHIIYNCLLPFNPSA